MLPPSNKETMISPFNIPHDFAQSTAEVVLHKLFDSSKSTPPFILKIAENSKCVKKELQLTNSGAIQKETVKCAKFAFEVQTLKAKKRRTSATDHQTQTKHPSRQGNFS